MKKLFFILLTSMCALGQTSTGKEQKFPYGIRNMLPQTMTTATYLSTIGSDGTMGRILPSSLSNTFNPVIYHLEYNNTDKTVWCNGKSNIVSSTSYGDSALKSNTTGENNSAYGAQVLAANTTGSGNAAFGDYALNANTVGYQNSTFGSSSLPINVGGHDNSAFGNSAMSLNTEGSNNCAYGGQALASNDTGSNNVAVGFNSLFQNDSNRNTVIGSNALKNIVTFSHNNVSVGYNAGSYLPDGSTENNQCSNSVFLGADIKVNDTGLTNQIAIGYGAVAGGSNSVVIGNSSIVSNTFNGQVRADYFLKTGGTSSQILMADGSVSTILSGSATLDFPSTLAGTSSELTITVSGAADGDVISLGIANASFNTNSCYTARVSASNTVSVAFNNYSASPIDPSSATFKVKILK